MDTIAKLMAAHHITFDEVLVDVLPDGAEAYAVHFHRHEYRIDGQLTGAWSSEFSYTQGSGVKHKPRGNEVLWCLAMDAMYFATNDEWEFAEWASEYGYSDDSIKALKTFEACRTNYDKLKMVLGEVAFGEVIGLVRDGVEE